MARYIVHCGRQVRFVTDQRPIDSESYVEVPAEKDSVTAASLLRDYVVRDGELRRVDALFACPEGLRIAHIGVHGIPCGIATYGQWLWAETAKLVEEQHLFVEDVPRAENAPGITYCWKRGEPLVRLVEAVREYDPDVVFIQHEYGLFPDARHWLSLLSGLSGIRTLVTLHSVYQHLDKLVCEAAIPEIIVHTQSAKDLLKNVKKVPGYVAVIPHGCFPCDSQQKHWNIYKSEHTLVQFGFGFKYKGWETSLEAVALLKEKFPDVFFTGLFSESHEAKPFHRQYLAELRGKAAALGIEANVALIPGYQSEESLDAYLRTNRLAIYPYRENGEHTVWATSGAALRAMSVGIPTVVSKVPLFDNLEGVCPRVGDATELAQAIEEMFGDKGRAAAQVARQNAFLEDNTWAKAAGRYLDLV